MLFFCNNPYNNSRLFYGLTMNFTCPTWQQCTETQRQTTLSASFFCIVFFKTNYCLFFLYLPILITYMLIQIICDGGAKLREQPRKDFSPCEWIISSSSASSLIREVEKPRRCWQNTWKYPSVSSWQRSMKYSKQVFHHSEQCSVSPFYITLPLIG